MLMIYIPPRLDIKEDDISNLVDLVKIYIPPRLDIKLPVTADPSLLAGIYIPPRLDIKINMIYIILIFMIFTFLQG